MTIRPDLAVARTEWVLETLVEFDASGFEIPRATETCRNFPSPDCEGDVFVRYSGAMGYPSHKCDGCDAALQETLRGVRERYPDSSVAPSWFDPTYAGESWDDDY